MFVHKVILLSHFTTFLDQYEPFFNPFIPNECLSLELQNVIYRMLINKQYHIKV